MIYPDGEPGAVLTLQEEERVQRIAAKRLAEVRTEHPDAVVERTCEWCGTIAYRVPSKGIEGIAFGPLMCDRCGV